MENDGDRKHDLKIVMRIAGCDDSTLVLQFIRELAEYERLLDSVVITEETIRQWISAKQVEVLIAEYEEEPAGFALYYFTYSTFRGQAGMYLEDIFVRPRFRAEESVHGFFINLQTLLRHATVFVLTGWYSTGMSAVSVFMKNLGAKAIYDWITFRLHDAAMERLTHERKNNATSCEH